MLIKHMSVAVRSQVFKKLLEYTSTRSIWAGFPDMC